MKSWIRFDDTYGMYDIYCHTIGMEPENIDKVKKMLKVNDDLYVSFGLGIVECLRLSDSSIMQLKNSNIDNITFVIDVDNLSGDKTKVLTYEELCNIMNITQNRLKQYNCNVDLHFVFAVYAAETIVLYQYVSNTHTNIEKYVHKVDTDMLHLILVSHLSENTGNIKNAKRVREYLNIDVLKNKMKSNLQYNPDGLNAELINWLLSGCNSEGVFDIMSAKDKLNQVNGAFANFIITEPHKFPVNSIQIDLNSKLYDIAQQLGVKLR